MRCPCHLWAIVFAKKIKKNLKEKRPEKKIKSVNLKKKERTGTERDSKTGTERVSFKVKAIFDNRAFFPFSVHFSIFMITVHFFLISVQFEHFHLNTVHFFVYVLFPNFFIFEYRAFSFLYAAHFGANVRASMRAAKCSGARNVLTLACCIEWTSIMGSTACRPFGW